MFCLPHPITHTSKRCCLNPDAKNQVFTPYYQSIIWPAPQNNPIVEDTADNFNASTILT